MRAQDLNYSGSLLAVPGLEDGGAIDALPFLFSTKQLDLNASANDQYMVPFDGKVKAAVVQTEQAASGESATMNFGTVADNDAFGTFTVDDSTEAGIHILKPADLSAVDVNAGDVVRMASGGGASTSKACALAMVIVPTTE
jgi:hypothetical protein